MQQIADWLKKLGLEQYAQRFAENDINFAILPDLTDQDLKEIGVSSIGHRRQIVRAIALLEGAPVAAPATVPPPRPLVSVVPDQCRRAHRRIDTWSTLARDASVANEPIANIDSSLNGVAFPAASLSRSSAFAQPRRCGQSRAAVVWPPTCCRDRYVAPGILRAGAQASGVVHGAATLT